MCNKVPYISKTEALKDAKLIKVNNKRFKKHSGKSKSQKLRPYLCPMCDNWHLTTLAKNVTRSWHKKSVIIN